MSLIFSSYALELMVAIKAFEHGRTKLRNSSGRALHFAPMVKSFNVSCTNASTRELSAGQSLVGMIEGVAVGCVGETEGPYDGERLGSDMTGETEGLTGDGDRDGMVEDGD